MLKMDNINKLDKLNQDGYTTLPNKLLYCNKLNIYQRNIIFTLITYKNLKNINLSISFLCKKLTLSNKTIIKHTNSLIKLNIISKKNITNGDKKTNEYEIILHSDNLINLISDSDDFKDADIQTPQQDIKNAPRGITKQINSIGLELQKIINNFNSQFKINITNKAKSNINKLLEREYTEEDIMLVYDYVMSDDWYINNDYNNLEIATNPDKFDNKLKKAKKQKEQSRQYKKAYITFNY